MRVFHHYLLVKGKNSSISHTRRNEVQGLVTKDSHWWSCLGLIFHQTIGWHESDLYFMTEKQQTNKSTWGIERLENSSWSWKSQEVGEALAKLTKTPGKKEKQNSTFVKKTLNMINEHESWRVNSQSFSCHANTFLNTKSNPWKRLYVHYTSIKSPKHKLGSWGNDWNEIW